VFFTLVPAEMAVNMAIRAMMTMACDSGGGEKGREVWGKRGGGGERERGGHTQ
jgi:hypothetical protein